MLFVMLALVGIASIKLKSISKMFNLNFRTSAKRSCQPIRSISVIKERGGIIGVDPIGPCR